MTKEQSPTDRAFGFTEHETLYGKITHERFQAILQDEATTIHLMEESTNSYGSFLFVTVSRSGPTDRRYRTMWGAGFHEHRERWITDSWQWYETYRAKREELPLLDRDEALEQFQEHMAYIQATASPPQQSRRAQLFELIADVTDDDGALTELEDLGWFDGEDN
jgi:hypothetical protein